MKSSSSATDSESVVISSREHALIDTCSLVLSAKNINHQIRQDHQATIQIICAPEIAGRARYQLDRYFEENRNWPPPQPLVRHPSFPALLPTLVLIGVWPSFSRSPVPGGRDLTGLKQGQTTLAQCLRAGNGIGSSLR